MGLVSETSTNVNQLRSALFVTFPLWVEHPCHVPLSRNAHLCSLLTCDHPLLHDVIYHCPFQNRVAKVILLNLFFLIGCQPRAFQGYFQSCKFIEKIRNAFLSLHAQDLFVFKIL